MPDDSKKSHDKKKNDPKEQRKPRQKNQQSASEKKQEKKTEEPKNVPKVPQKPVYESPPPEFYKNLKRETDEILKITEEENTKYKKKEIQSNWSKYEMPIESYEEIEEQENLGADYEKLIQAPMSIGGHFQFKHEKSWDLNTGPSLYDKYFEINMEDLNIALCTIPFYERNSIEESNFSQEDILTMNNRSTRFKQKYFNDKSYSTPETEALDKICSNLREGVHDSNTERDKDNDDGSNDVDIKCNDDKKTLSETENRPGLTTEPTDAVIETTEDNETKTNVLIQKTEPTPKLNNVVDNIVSEVSETSKPDVGIETVSKNLVCHMEEATELSDKVPPSDPVVPKVETVVTKVADTPVHKEAKKNPVIGSPEDLEKWLDDYLDG